MLDEEEQWCPTISEIGIILKHLDLSPPHSDNECDDIILVNKQKPIRTLEKNLSESEESCATIIVDELNREDLLIKLLDMKKEEVINGMKNNWFHENLVKHFKKKQMTHVYCADEDDDDENWNKYMKKLCELDKIKKQKILNYEKWDIELSTLLEEIRSEQEKEKIVLEEIISVGKNIGTCGQKHGKVLSAKCVEELISKQMEKLKQISRCRFRHMKLRADYVLIQETLSDLTAKNANLTKDDYEKLEAEKFYYQIELQDKTNKCQQLMAKNISLKNEIMSVQSQILQINAEITECKKILHDSRETISKLLETKRTLRNELRAKKKFVDTFKGIFSHGMKEKIDCKLTEIRREHEIWIKKIANTLRLIKCTEQNLNAIETNLILHEKNARLDLNKKTKI